MARLALPAALAAVCGCSWMRLSHPGPAPVGERVSCDPDSRVPLADAVASVLAFSGGLLGLVWLLHAEPENPTGQIVGSGLLGLLVSGAVFSSSARYGERVTDECARVSRGGA